MVYTLACACLKVSAIRGDAGNAGGHPGAAVIFWARIKIYSHRMRESSWRAEEAEEAFIWTCHAGTKLVPWQWGCLTCSSSECFTVRKSLKYRDYNTLIIVPLLKISLSLRKSALKPCWSDTCPPHCEELPAWRPGNSSNSASCWWVPHRASLHHGEAAMPHEDLDWLTATPNFRHGFWRQAQWSPAPFIRRDPKSVRLIRASLQPELKPDRKTAIKGTTKKARWGLGLSGMVQLSSSPSFFLHNTHRQAAHCAAPIDVCPHPPKKSLHTPPAPLHESNHR